MLRLVDFEGAWRVHRVIEGRPMAGHLVGDVEYWRDGGGLIYRETGKLTLSDGRAFEAHRDYHWVQEGEKIVVSFADGRSFHDFVPEQTAAGRHWCSPDVYEVTYDFAHWPVWTCRWHVTGPQKDYQMLTRFTRKPE